MTGYDLPQVFTAGWVWAVPIGKGGFSTGNRISDYVLGNWQINGIATLESGRPYTVQDEGDIANTGNFNFVRLRLRTSEPSRQSEASKSNAEPVD